ncbi:hypothetical protein [Microbacterium sp. Se5.02b]|uniref:hypothetical protein n=1 Tax=Microbacterium sp. Se5.02b TaxID=2864103 RepID=UPI001C68E423|nr:hypothetical protein [Microbacterium sp. Se5.02b]QYM65585.1 hypothetical protein K1X59_07855 [Microbacterium sp. Se5.02b]
MGGALQTSTTVPARTSSGSPVLDAMTIVVVRLLSASVSAACGTSSPFMSVRAAI